MIRDSIPTQKELKLNTIVLPVHLENIVLVSNFLRVLDFIDSEITLIDLPLLEVLQVKNLI